MTNAWKEQLIDSVESYVKAAEREAYDKVLTILWSNYNQLDNLLSSDEANRIALMANVNRFDKLYEKRRAIRIKINMLLKIINQVTEFRYGKL